MNKKLIEQLQNGEIAVKNDGTVEELKKVMESAFDEDSTPNGHNKYYYLHMYGKWACGSYTDLPIV